MNIDLIETLLISLRVALAGMAGAGLIAVPVAFILARFDFPGKWLLSAITLLPLVMPPVVTGYVLLVLFGPHGPLGSLLSSMGIELAFRWTGAALAAGLVALPLIIRPLRVALEAVDPDLHEALKVAGHGRISRFVKLDLPLVWPGLVAGLMLGFAKALGEFGATITFVANIPGETRTLALAVYTALQSVEGEQIVWILCTISILISVLAVGLSEWLVARFDKRRKEHGHA
ncbi:MAG: molybdate ABC transporter permease subunit [Hyphomicrobiaceae bacterium]|nr:molybdate ABC transporter permease subunit [Hyphomicrobiaceae bacterium]MCC0024076.1 molybdate ABC transporter permease subunit [Hyphomicrobiaceae bacterium]